MQIELSPACTLKTYRVNAHLPARLFLSPVFNIQPQQKINQRQSTETNESTRINASSAAATTTTTEMKGKPETNSEERPNRERRKTIAKRFASVLVGIFSCFACFEHASLVQADDATMTATQQMCTAAPHRQHANPLHERAIRISDIQPERFDANVGWEGKKRFSARFTAITVHSNQSAQDPRQTTSPHKIVRGGGRFQPVTVTSFRDSGNVQTTTNTGTSPLAQTTSRLHPQHSKAADKRENNSGPPRAVLQIGSYSAYRREATTMP